MPNDIETTFMRHRQHMYVLYVLQDKRLSEVMKIMKTDYKINAGRTYYEEMLNRTWHFYKKIKVEEWKWIKFMTRKLEIEGIKANFYIRGRPVSEEKFLNTRHAAVPTQVIADTDVEPPQPDGFVFYVPKQTQPTYLSDEDAIILAYEPEAGLLAAAKNGYIHSISRLIEQGVDVNCTDARRRTPLHLAVAVNQITEPTQVLPPTLSNGDGEDVNTPFANRFRNTWSEIICHLLLQAGSDPNRRDNNGRTPLLTAVIERAPVGVIATLLKNGADPNKPSTCGSTSLSLAVTNQLDPKIIKLLLEFGAEAGERVHGMAPLHWAVIKSETEVVSLLLEYLDESQVNDISIQGDTSWDYVRERSNHLNCDPLATMEIAQLLRGRGALSWIDVNPDYIRVDIG